MITTLIGQKMEQTQNFLENGLRVPVTGIAVSDNVVLQVKTMDKDSYSAIQLGAGVKKKPIKAYLGHAKKAGLKEASIKIKEISVKGLSDEDLPKTGDMLTLDSVFKPGDIVQVTGTSKGKGFAGVVRRYNFRGGPKTHGQSDRHRAPGSIGQSTTPGRVYKGKRMAGRMGSDTVTVKNLVVVDVDAEAKLLYVSGLIPGHRNSWVYITRTGENKKFVPLISDKETVAEVAESAPEVQEESKAEAQPVVTPEEEVKTAPETVEEAKDTVATATETVETPAEEVKVSEDTNKTKADTAEGVSEPEPKATDKKEENANS